MCLPCRQKVEGLHRIDPLIKNLFQANLAIARMPRPRRSPALVGGVAAAAATAVILAVVFLTPQKVSGPLATPTMTSSAPEQPSIPKAPDSPALIERAKPEDTAKDLRRPPVVVSPATVPDKKTPEFLVTDPAGYSRTLTDYRNYVLVFGVWHPTQPRAVANLEKIYKALGTNTKLRIVGVADVRTPKPANTTFPLAYNQNSSLLGAKVGEFYVVDAKGTVRMRGSLLQDTNSLLKSLKATLSELGIR